MPVLLIVGRINAVLNYSSKCISKEKRAKADPNDERVGEGKMPGLRYPTS